VNAQISPEIEKKNGVGLRQEIENNCDWFNITLATQHQAIGLKTTLGF